MLFVNLPVGDVGAARAFYEALGFTFHQLDSDEGSASMVVDESIVVRVLARDRFADLVTGEVGDPTAGTTVLLSLTADSREEVDDLVARALGAGGRPWLAARDTPSGHSGSFTDPDGHVWEIRWIDQLHVVN
jgi:predicted lactoylglutathione lyase